MVTPTREVPRESGCMEQGPSGRHNQPERTLQRETPTPSILPTCPESPPPPPELRAQGIEKVGVGLGTGGKQEMATHSSILAWRIPCAEEPGGL